MRQDGEDEETILFRQALSELRECNISLASWDLLSTRVQNRLTPQETAIFDDVLTWKLSTISDFETATSQFLRSYLHILGEERRRMRKRQMV